MFRCDVGHAQTSTYHSILINGVEAHYSDMKVHYGWTAVLLGRPHLVIELRILWQNVVECQTCDPVPISIKQLLKQEVALQEVPTLYF
jgi:hypothetical protein